MPFTVRRPPLGPAGAAAPGAPQTSLTVTASLTASVVDRPPAPALPFKFSALFFLQPWVFCGLAAAPEEFSLRLILFMFMLMELIGTFVCYCHKLKLFGCAPLGLIYWSDDGPVAAGEETDRRILID